MACGMDKCDADAAHDVGPFRLMGVMCGLPGYASGDYVRYAGAVYRPHSHERRDYGSGPVIDHFLYRFGGHQGEVSVMGESARWFHS